MKTFIELPLLKVHTEDFFYTEDCKLSFFNYSKIVHFESANDLDANACSKIYTETSCYVTSLTPEELLNKIKFSDNKLYKAINNA